jgi:molybdopterin-containing oxidoreductase family iron-sulfur binding subunit
MLVSTQTHHTLMGRHMVKETTLPEFVKNPAAGNHKEELVVSDGHKHEKKDPRKLDLWATKENPGFDKPGLFWNMSIDLSSCIGCGNCVVSCQAENNVAVVGKDEVRKSREMHWIRIDRYYSSDTTKENAPEDAGMIGTYKLMEIPSENPTVVFQPVMCQHCNHAPCETVCPVLATTHSTEGLNQMTYNRCVGTKYCANNCPYKVRRFNWFKYFDNSDYDFNMNNDLGKMVLNPDVTVRSRGVMEKCSMCIQRIQEGKLTAKKEGRKINDGEVKTACQQSCPTEAITFGNVNDQNSKIAAANKDERSYNILEELAVLPSVYYWVKVRNTDAPAHSGGHHA